MLYRMRLKDGSVDPASSGTWVDNKGKAIRLKASDIQAQALETWKSPKTNAVYPVRWKISVPRLRLDFEAKADFPDQELDTKQSTRVVYWEGSVSLKGKRESRVVGGEGYMELTGYETSKK
jgi:predicted secreted hydrolase